MKSVNDNHKAIRRPEWERWIGITLAIVVFFGLSYGVLQLWHRSDQSATAVQPFAGESITIPVEGMSCSACVARVKGTLKAMEGVSEIHVSLEKKRAEIGYLSEKTSPAKLVKAIDELGYKAGSPKPKEPTR